MTENEINELFGKALNFATNQEIEWVLKNELERDEMIEILKNLNSDRKLSIIENLENKGILYFQKNV